ncbi:MAG: hypothetical protein J0H54_05580 [Rhizobiales bacterium]|nr:hypothetical protein [Hyphomicrobiales bacterium]
MVPFEHQPELRALLPFSEIPAGHLTVLVRDRRFWPHLHQGEFAVVDMSDREPEHRELFVIAYSDSRLQCGHVYEVCETVLRDRDGLWSMRHGHGTCTEGPIELRYLREKLVGRIVGFYVPALSRRAAT